MRRFIIGILLACLLCTPVLADQLSTSGLTDQQIADLKAKIAQTQADNTKDKTPSTLSPSNISEYAQLGRDIGAGLSSTAREIGVATNEFAQTPVGHTALLLIIYKLVGRDLVHYVGGMVWFTIMLPLWIILFRRMYLYKSIEIKFDPNTGKKSSVINTPMDVTKIETNVGRIVMGFVLLIACIIGFIITFA